MDTLEREHVDTTIDVVSKKRMTARRRKVVRGGLECDFDKFGRGRVMKTKRDRECQETDRFVSIGKPELILLQHYTTLHYTTLHQNKDKDKNPPNKRSLGYWLM